MILQMSEGSPKTTLGDLQGDQSEVQLSKSPSFYSKSRGNNRSMKLCVAVYNYDALQIKGESWSTQAGGRSSAWILRSISTKESFKRNNNDGTCLHLWIRVYQPRG
jgi:hypothetical protein